MNIHSGYITTKQRDNISHSLTTNHIFSVHTCDVNIKWTNMNNIRVHNVKVHIKIELQLEETFLFGDLLDTMFTII